MKLFVVLNLKGDESLVGVFDSRDKAELVVRVNPQCYSLHECDLNKINMKFSNVVQNEEHQKKLNKLLLKYERYKKGKKS
ncbi:MAG: hypothetical protein GY795_40880 [Desulfobacterales bacterium]|nr:hypothetical protein [Desulfobacterales bacterium]